jgi:hypothetical protein
MSDPAKSGRSGLGVGEGIGLAAVFISGLGLWNSWRGDDKQGPTEVVEKKAAVPLVLRGKVEDKGQRLVIEPVEQSHALDSLKFVFASGKTIEIGSNGTLNSDAVESALPENVARQDGQVIAAVTTRYVEAGQERTATRRYGIRYRWDGGGLFTGKSLRIVDFRRA